MKTTAKDVKVPDHLPDDFCMDPSHDIPGHLVIPPGRFEHRCPSCGKITIVTPHPTVRW